MRVKNQTEKILFNTQLEKSLVDKIKNFADKNGLKYYKVVEKALIDFLNKQQEK